MREIPIGTDDFRMIRETNCLYVDKSLLIAEVLANSRILLLPRPRRFGKTLNMTMLQAFFDQKQDSRVLFEGLAISRNAEAMTHLNGYPTIFLSLKSLKARTWEKCCIGITELIGDMLACFYDDLDLPQLSPSQREKFQAAYDQKAPIDHLKSSLKILTKLLYLSTGKKVVLLIDEYDTPIHEGHEFGYYPEMVDFMRGFLGEALKGNPYLERAVITGILRVAKESIYSGLNNLTVYSVLNTEFATCFGFTEAEVTQLLVEGQSPHPLAEVQAWYNGYRFGSEIIYNPWSILHMLGKRAAPLTVHWINTSSNTLIANLIKHRDALHAEDLEALLRGEIVTRKIREAVAMVEIDRSSVWGLLLFSGYLTAQTWDATTQMAGLRLPNLEVRSFFEDTVVDWLGSTDLVRTLVESLLALDLERFAKLLADSIENILSYHDVGGPRQEKTYHVFMVGLLASLHDRYEVLSNRESGFGRYDLALLPRVADLPGFIFEFKQAQPKNLTKTAKAALTQITERDYASTMRQLGVAKIVTLGLAFSGKRVALASTAEDVKGNQTSAVVCYTAEPEEEAAPLVQPEAMPREVLIGKLQLLKELKDEPPFSAEQLAGFDQSRLETMLLELKASLSVSPKED